MKDIVRSYTTEKSSRQQETGKYTFLVHKDATKIDIKNAIKTHYGVDVDKVRISISPKKTRMLKNRYEWIKRPKFKKATVTLKGKATIDPHKIKEPKPKK